MPDEPGLSSAEVPCGPIRSIETFASPPHGAPSSSVFRIASTSHARGHCVHYTKNLEDTLGLPCDLLRRGLHGVYQDASKKHLGRYVDEFSFRLNEGNVRRQTWDRLDSFVNAVAGKRLTYERRTQ